MISDGCFAIRGYDNIRVADEFRIFTNVNSTTVDSQAFRREIFRGISAGTFVIVPPNSFALDRSVEYFRIPRNVLTLCVGKSTYARCGIIVNVTPFEPEWRDLVTLEISNTTPLPAKICVTEGLCQCRVLLSRTNSAKFPTRIKKESTSRSRALFFRKSDRRFSQW